MIASRLMRLGGLVGLVGLYAACAAKIHNLGDEGSAGAGSDSGGAGGKSATTPKGGAGGKSATTPKGGAGGKSATTPKGGAEGNSVGGGTVGATLAYPLAPTLPVEPSCTCPSSTQICNAANQCVDRCESTGVCASWLTAHSVTAMYAEGSTLYYATAPATDPLGNPGKNGALYRVEHPGGTPTPIATGLLKVTRIVGRYGGATYLEGQTGSTCSLYRASDAGEVSAIDDFAYGYKSSLRDNRLVYTSADRMSLRLLELDRSYTPVTLVTLAAGGSEPNTLEQSRVLQHTIWYGKHNPDEICNIDLADISKPPVCKLSYPYPGDVAPIVGTSGDVLFVSLHFRPLTLVSFAPDGSRLLTLANYDGTPYTSDAHLATSLSGGWLYSWLSGTDSATARLVRYPTSVGRLPQIVIPAEVGTPSVVNFADGSVGRSDSNFAVSDAGVFWVQPVADPNQGQYIFHAPLPPQPCDAELPCANTAQVCSNGFCAAQ